MAKTPELLSSALLFAAGAPVWVNRPIHDGDVPLHRHDWLELTCVVDGHALHRTIHGLAPIGPGEAVVIHPGHWHAYEGCRGLRLINACLAAPALAREFAWTGSDPLLGRVMSGSPGVQTLRLPENALPAIGDELDAVRAVQRADPLRHRADMVGRVLVVLGLLARHAAVPRGDGHALAPAITSALQLMEGDLARPWKLTELARRVALAPAYLVRQFRRATGHPPLRWLNHRRAEVMAVQLLTTTKPLAEIARTVGWSDADYASRRFRAVFAQPPGAYRRQLPVPAIHEPPAGWLQW